MVAVKWGYFKNEETRLTQLYLGHEIAKYLQNLVNIGDIDVFTSDERLENLLEIYFTEYLRDETEKLNITFSHINFIDLAIYYNDEKLTY